MNEFLDAIGGHWYIALGVCGGPALMYAFLPGLFLRLGVLLYPTDHERRMEFLRELEHVPYRERPNWVAGQLVHCLFEGPSARVHRAREERAAKEARRPADEPEPQVPEQPTFTAPRLRPASSEFYEFVNALEDLPCMRNEDTRARILEQLPFAGRIRYFAARRAHVTSILRTCIDSDNGVLELMNAIRRFESHDSSR